LKSKAFSFPHSAQIAALSRDAISGIIPVLSGHWRELVVKLSRQKASVV
jgi:hypothetical protein